MHSLFIAVSTGPIVLKEHILNKKQLPVPRQCVGFSLSLHLFPWASTVCLTNQVGVGEFPYNEYLIHNKVFSFIVLNL